MRTAKFDGIATTRSAATPDHRDPTLHMVRSRSRNGSRTRLAAGPDRQAVASGRRIWAQVMRRGGRCNQRKGVEERQRRPPSTEPRAMNRQVLPSMFLSVLIVCVCAVALRPVERGLGRESDLDVDVVDAPSTSAPPADPPSSSPRPEAEATEREPEPEPEPAAAREAPTPPEVADQLEPAEAEPPAEPVEPSPAPAVGLVLPSLDEPPADQTAPPPDDRLVGPPGEAASIASPPGIETSSIDEEPSTEEPSTEEPSTPARVEPVEVPIAAAEPVDQPLLGSDSIVIPRNNAGFRAEGAKETPDRAAVRDRAPRAGAEPSRQVKPARPASRFWTPSR